MEKTPVTQEYLDLNIRLGSLKFITGEWRYEKGWEPASIYLRSKDDATTDKLFIISNFYLDYLAHKVRELETLEVKQ